MGRGELSRSMTEADHDLLAAYVTAAAIPRARTDRRKYPIYVGRVARLGMDLLGLRVEEALRRLDERGVGDDRIAAAFANPTRIMRAVHTFNEGLIAADVSKARRQALVLRLVRLAQLLKAGDVFCRDGMNLVLPAAEAESLAGSLEREPAAPSVVDAFQRLAATLWAAAESLYFACHGVAREQHGAYRLADGTLLIVRDYRELMPAELWPELPPLRHSSLRLLAWHTADAEVEWDAFNNLYLHGAPLAQTLTAAAVTNGDGTPLSMASLGAVTDELLALVAALGNRIARWSEEEIAHQYLKVLWWQVRPLQQLLGEDWQPPDSVFERLASSGVGPQSDHQPMEAEIRAKMDLL
jgi:hypothetical protein